MTDGISSLRERKKRRTRAALVDVAAELFLRQGYDKTTVDQIAAAAEVSTRTFSRYFPTKDAVISALADEIDEDMAVAMKTQPPHLSDLEAIKRTMIAIFDPNGDYPRRAFGRMAVIIQIVNAAPSLNGMAFTIRHNAQDSPTMAAIAARMGLAPGDAPVRLVGDVWTLLLMASFADLTHPFDAVTLCERIEAVYAIYVRLALPWRHNGQPEPVGSVRRE